MKKIRIVAFLLILLALPVNTTATYAAWAGGPSHAGFFLQSNTGSGNTVYLPLVSVESPPAVIPYTSPYRINARFLSDDTWLAPTAITWFGQLSLSDNYVDARVGYTPTELVVRMTVLDRLLFYDTTPSAADLTNYDAVVLFLRTDGPAGSAPDASSYKFVAQSFPFDKDPTPFKAAYRGNGTKWQAANLPFNIKPVYRGGGGYNNMQDNQGWSITYYIPYTSLGLSGQPATGTVWGIGATVYDRDDPTASVHSISWPPEMEQTVPSKWAQLGFGFPQYTAAAHQNERSITIRRGLNATNVPDAAVGGSTVCGQGVDNYFLDWGNKPESFYANKTVNNTQFNIQNQGDLSDFPCFSKYYVTFPLNAIPAGKVIVSAKLVLHHWGGAATTSGTESFIHVMSVADDWNESTLTWNNAPLPIENFDYQKVQPLPNDPGPIGIAYTWSVTPALVSAYQSGQPLRLVLYSTDEAMDSGKYFWASNRPDGEESRPTLLVTYGDPAN